jgi:hypothetical protein
MEELGNQIDALSNKLTDLRLEFWTKYTLFTWQWWMLIIFTLGVVLLCAMLIRKNNLLSAIAFLGLVFILNKNLDELATAMDWYDYRMQEEPIIPTMLTANLFVIPGAMAILYVRYKSWKSFMIAIAAFSGFLAYIALPLMEMAKIYSDKAWNSHWSFVSLILMAVASKWIVDTAVRFHRTTPDRKDEPSEIDLTGVGQRLLGRKRSKVT